MISPNSSRRGQPDLGAFVAFAMVFLSFLRIGSEVGALIAADFFALGIIALKLRSFWAMSRATHLWIVFIGLVLIGMTAQVVNGINELVFVARLFLTILDGLALALLVRPDRSNLVAVLQSVALAYALGFVLFLFSSTFSELVDLKSPKAWIAVGPMFFVYLAHVRGWPVARLAALGVVLLMALLLESRTLLITCLLFILYVYLRARLIWKIAGSVLMLAIAMVLVTQLDSLVTAQEHSNSFRSAMILQITRFSFPELLLGRGIDAWRIEGLRDLINLPGASEFFEAANPHFFPAEAVIRGGFLWLALIAYLFYAIARGSTTWALGYILVIGSFFTTNTGFERFIISIGVFIALIGRPEFPLWLGIRTALPQPRAAATALKAPPRRRLTDR